MYRPFWRCLSCLWFVSSFATVHAATAPPAKMCESAPLDSSVKKGTFYTVLVALGFSVINAQSGTAAAATRHGVLQITKHGEMFHTRESPEALKVGSVKVGRAATKGDFHAVARRRASSKILEANQGLDVNSGADGNSQVLGRSSVQGLTHAYRVERPRYSERA